MPRRMAAQQIQLQLPHLIGGDALVGKRTEAGRDAVAQSIGANGLAHDIDAALASACAQRQRERTRGRC